MILKNGTDYDPTVYFRFNFAGNDMIVSTEPLPIRLRNAISLFLEPILVEDIPERYRDMHRQLIASLDRTLTTEEAVELAMLFVRLKENLAGDYHQSLGG